ncbi:N-acetyltransferase [Asticcacaulis sp. EMRT-3]|uniref:GNAT family N-acetyltransferase n=1 Tax=Asticcacaulis sp. EMRT-3 TaxID=3040349 RepID=UPI0024AF78D4|nr:N-acetyltransferase [Asticcacaulis sp. EMRT-3]MDI7774888.1 N-acetyltransferase [Asticcacaulis sp. EMRT-3]
MALDILALDYTITCEAPSQAEAITALTDHAFGPGRFVKTAERLRENSTPLADLSFVALVGDELIGSVRLWPVFVRHVDSEAGTPLAFLGPIVVADSWRGREVGKTLIRHAVEAAFARGLPAVLLVGARSYFEPLGFVRADGLTLPGPVDPNRLLIACAHADVKLRGQVVTVI